MDRGVYRVTERTEAGGALGAGGRSAFNERRGGAPPFALERTPRPRAGA